jgi:hypothetical protein
VTSMAHWRACGRRDFTLSNSHRNATRRRSVATYAHAGAWEPGEVLKRWKEREGSERERPRTAQRFCVPKADIAASGTYDLSLNRYREVEHEAVEYEVPADIIRELREIEGEISKGLTRLEEMLR